MNTPETQFTLNFASKDQLLSAYMPFIKNGALFVHTNKPYQLGAEITLKIILPEDTVEYTVSGKIVWITPTAAQWGMRAGIGVRFESSPANVSLREKIEGLLVGMLYTDRQVDTL